MRAKGWFLSSAIVFFGIALEAYSCPQPTARAYYHCISGVHSHTLVVTIINDVGDSIAPLLGDLSSTGCAQHAADLNELATAINELTEFPACRMRGRSQYRLGLYVATPTPTLKLVMSLDTFDSEQECLEQAQGFLVRRAR